MSNLTVTFDAAALPRHPALATTFSWEDANVEANVVVEPDMVHSIFDTFVVSACRYNDDGETVEVFTDLDALCAAAGTTREAIAKMGLEFILDLDD